jgi:hypothetical protein
MSAQDRVRRAAITGLLAVLVVLTQAGAAFGASASAVARARAQLADLAVHAPLSMVGYDREDFPHWDPRPALGEGCDVRDQILRRDGTGVRFDANCTATAGRWRDPYGGTTIRVPLRVDIDHVVPLANAWRSGARRWTVARREAFANDPRNLLAVSASLNRAKGDDGPEEWLPPRRAYRVDYAVRWIGVKARYRLSVTRAEKRALSLVLAGRRVLPPAGGGGSAQIPPASSCDPNYAGACVPMYPPDVDCPDVGAPVRVVGKDPHRLDGDGDGMACLGGG